MIRACAALGAVLMLAGCQSSLMTKASSAATTVGPNDATVVFTRPSSFGGAIQSTVYDVTGGKTAFGGVVSAKTEVSMVLPAGEHQLMVVGESADFMDATLAAGKTYYVLVEPRMGMWKARFSLIPIRSDATAKINLHSSKFADWKKSCMPSWKTSAADAWYTEHKADIESKRVEYLDKWNRKTSAEKAERTLQAQDGV
ncbi:hypothetical protein B0E52_05095 [Rhodanobacter sp. C06]|uniref:hypothetical protein n=1 Tax=Rhodanobacter sp. C06 TaxID=1945854 RepID=UPI0009D37843|nr:hypothetical protein [Rhodanobacter sp. C06]OOG46339.1 hypothetical protein B0E52_05095 [Rhodanobacter sp. C06]